MKKSLLFLLALIMGTTSALAVPAKPVKRIVRLADGTVKELTLRGDENAHYFLDTNGSVYLQDTNGAYLSADMEDIQTRRKARAQANVERRQMRAAKRRAKWGSTTNPISGKKTGLVILVSFADKPLKYTQQDFNDYFNKVGYNKFQMGGSVHDYFYSQSYGQFDLSFDVVGPVQLSKNLSYYGANDLSGNDKHAAEMVGEAIDLAQQAGTDFSKYDWDGDGEVDQVYVIYAGYGEASGAPANTIWPHEYDLTSGSYYGDGTGARKYDNVKIDTYACSNELCGTSGSNIDGIGTACHEFSHCMCIPDMYDTDGKNFGMSYWDLMDAGCYAGPNQNGECPVGYTSYERMYCGWLKPTVLTSGCQVIGMKNLDTTPEAYIIYNDKTPNEYYLLENRQQEGWFRYGFGHGMLVLHVDFSSQAWLDNTVNNTASHQRMTIIPADNTYNDTYVSDFAGDPFPGTKNKTSLTDTSKPAATLYNANTDGRKFMGKPITNIAERNGLISFDFNGGRKLDTPTGITTSEVTANGFTVSWNPVDLALAYELTLVATDTTSIGSDEASLVLEEEFEGFQSGSADGTYDVSTKLDQYTILPGWQGTKLFTTPADEVKVGTAITPGYIQTPDMQCTTGMATVYVYLRPYGTDVPKVWVAVSDDYIDSITLNDEGWCVVELEVGDEPFNLSFEGEAAKNRFYLDYVAVLNGSASDDEVKEMAFIPSRRGIRRVSEPILTTYTTTSTSYTFTGLSAAYNYAYSLRAKASNGVVSDWSELYDVSLPDAIRPIDLILSPSTSLYDLQGRSINRNIATPGIYVRDGRKYVVR